MGLFRKKSRRPKKELRGRVFHMHQEPTKDGAGLQTTIYLKGCPLNCLWCSRPEGISPEREPVWMEDECSGCGQCIQNSTAGGVRSANGKIMVAGQAGEAWDSLLEGCPTGAMRWNSHDKSVEEMMEPLLAQLPAHQHPEGGLILSGGDPLMQGPFVEKLLEACKKHRIPAGMVTELFGTWEVIDALMSGLDVLHVDLKLLDPALAKRYTGKGTMLIKDNLRKLLESPYKDKVIVRTTLIPEITATQENVGSIAEYLAGYDPQIPYELHNYDAETPSRYVPLRRPFFKPDMKPLSPEEMDRFVRIAQASGLTQVKAVS